MAHRLLNALGAELLLLHVRRSAWRAALQVEQVAIGGSRFNRAGVSDRLNYRFNFYKIDEIDKLTESPLRIAPAQAAASGNSIAIRFGPLVSTIATRI